MKILIIILLLNSINLSAEKNSIILSDEVHLEKISPGFYIHKSKIETLPWGDVWANGLIVIDEKILMIDTPWNNGQTKIIYEWIKEKTGRKVDTLIITHYHNDNQGGLSFCLEQKTNCFSLELTRDMALKKNLPLAGNYFKESKEFDIGSIKCIAHFPGAGHTQDNIIVWFPNEKILFGGCLVKSRKTMGLGNTAEADLEAWPKTISRLLKDYPKNILVIPGHGKQGGRELLEHTLMLTTPQVHG